MSDVYAILATQMDRAGVAFSPAEAHGLLCGLLAVNPTMSTESCVAEIIGDKDRGEDELSILGRLLIALVTEVRNGLQDENLGFQLFLPAYERSLQSRVGSLARWCDGFIAGIGLAGLDEKRRRTLPAVVEEFLNDLGEIVRVEPEVLENEEAERNYAELLEYVRMGVLLVAMEFQPPADSLKTVH